MRPSRAALLLTAQSFLVGRASAARQYAFSIHDDLLAFPQFQVTFPDTYVLDVDASSSLKASSSTPSPASPDNLPSIRTPQAGGQAGSSEDDGSSEVPRSYEYMMLDNIPHLCSIPQVKEREANDSAASLVNEAEQEQEFARARSKGSELIRSLDGGCIYWVSGYWAYSFCNNAEVKQFHPLANRGNAPPWPPVEDRGVQSYMLGRYVRPKNVKTLGQGKAVDESGSSKESTADASPQKATDLVQVQSKGRLNYLVSLLDQGTLCDLTGRPRKIEVQYRCNPVIPTEMIDSVKEMSTCSYLMIVETPRLCTEIVFMPPPPEQADQIVCREILTEDQVDDWKARRAARAQAEMAAAAQKQVGTNPANAPDDDAARDPAAAPDGRHQDQSGKMAGDEAAASEEEPSARGPIIGGIELGGMKVVGRPGRRIEPPANFLQPRPGTPKQQVVARYDPAEGESPSYRMLPDEELRQLDVDPDAVRDAANQMLRIASKKHWKIELVDNDDGEKDLMVIVEENGDEEGPGDQEGDEADETDDEEGSEEEYLDPRDEL